MELSHLNLVDIVVFGTILLSGVLALFRGFVREVLSLGAWIGAALATVYLYPLLQPWMHERVKSEFGANALTGLTLFCIALALLIPLGYLIGGLVRGKALTAIDRSIGFVFGLARGVLLVCILFLITLWVWPDQKKEPDLLAEARTRPFMLLGAEELKTLLPKEEVDKMSARMQAFDKESATAPSLEQLTTPAIAGGKIGITTTVNGMTAPAATTTSSGNSTVNLASPPPIPPSPPTPPPPPGKP